MSVHKIVSRLDRRSHRAPRSHFYRVTFHVLRSKPRTRKQVIEELNTVCSKPLCAKCDKSINVASAYAYDKMKMHFSWIYGPDITPNADFEQSFHIACPECMRNYRALTLLKNVHDQLADNLYDNETELLALNQSIRNIVFNNAASSYSITTTNYLLGVLSSLYGSHHCCHGSIHNCNALFCRKEHTGFTSLCCSDYSQKNYKNCPGPLDGQIRV